MDIFKQILLDYWGGGKKGVLPPILNIGGAGARAAPPESTPMPFSVYHQCPVSLCVEVAGIPKNLKVNVQLIPNDDLSPYSMSDHCPRFYLFPPPSCPLFSSFIPVKQEGAEHPKRDQGKTALPFLLLSGGKHIDRRFATIFYQGKKLSVST